MRGLESKAVVVVEDDPSMSRALERILSLGGYTAISYASAEALLADDGISGVICLIVDVQLPGINGFDLRDRLSTMFALPPVIFITAFDEPEARMQADRAGAAGFLAKPFSGRTLLETVHRLVERT